MRRNAPVVLYELPRLLCISILITTLGFCAFAQETTGSITGTVTDPSGAAIPDAKIEISGPAMVRVRSALSMNRVFGIGLAKGPIRLGRARRLTVYLVCAGLWLTGVAWLARYTVASMAPCFVF